MPDPNVVAIIHARGGSKRIPLKNLALLAGQPLLYYPIRLCQKLSWISRIIVSTDHDEIARQAMLLGAEVPFSRPPGLSEDVPSELVTEHALRYLIENEKESPDYAVTLTPATPLTRPETIDEAFRLLHQNPEWTSVTAVRPATEFPEWLLRVDETTRQARTVLGNSLDGEYNVSQNLPRAYYPTGAFWISRVPYFLKRPSMYGDKWGAVIRSDAESIDIDWPEDLERARATFRKGV